MLSDLNIVERLDEFKRKVNGKIPITLNKVRVLPTTAVSEILGVSITYLSTQKKEMIILENINEFCDTSDVIHLKYRVDDDNYPFKVRNHNCSDFFAFNGFKIACRIIYPQKRYGDYSEEIIECVNDLYYSCKLDNNKRIDVTKVEPADYFIKIYERVRKKRGHYNIKKVKNQIDIEDEMIDIKKERVAMRSKKIYEEIDFSQFPMNYKNELIIFHKHISYLFGLSDSTVANILSPSSNIYNYKSENFKENEDYYSLSLQELLAYNDNGILRNGLNARQYAYLLRGKSKFFTLKGIEKFARVVNRVHVMERINKLYFDRYKIDNNGIIIDTASKETDNPVEIKLEGMNDTADIKEVEISSVIDFNFNETEKIRIINDEEGNPKFNLSDICKILDLQTGASSIRLNDDCKFFYAVKDRIGRVRQMMFVNEQGMFDLILTSRKPEAKAFRTKVTSEILPKLMKIYGSSNYFETVQVKNDNAMTSLFENNTEEPAKAVSTVLKENDYVPDNLNAYDILVECAIKLRDHQKSLNEALAKAEDNSKKIESLQKQIDNIKPTVSINPNIDYCSLYMYARQNGFNLNFTMMDKLEKEADSISKEKGIFKDRIEDKMTGIINLYRHDICKEVFNTKYQKIYDEEVKRQQLI